MISDNRVRCPQCGSKDVIKPRVHSGGAKEPAKVSLVSHYLCLLCNNHFSKSSEDDKS